MARPGRFLGATRRAFAACGLVGAAFGALGAAAFGPGVASNVIAQLGSGAAATAVKLLLVANLFATFPIVCRSAFLVLEAAAQRAAGGMALSPLPQRALRAGFVVAASLAATLVPSFGGLIGLVGGVSLSLISLVLPALVVLLARNRAGGPLLRAGPLERAFAALVAAAGLAVVAFTLASPAA